MENIIIQLIICLIGLCGLVYGGDKLVEGSVNTATFLKVKPQFIAITIIALGTSLPELIVSVNAVLEKSSGIAWGNIVGSNISNILLVLGLASFFNPLSLDGEKSNLNIFWLFFATIIFFSICFVAKTISYIYGICFIFILAMFLFHITYNSKMNIDEKMKIEDKNSFSLIYSVFFIFFGILILIVSSKVVVSSSVKIASYLNVPETLIGLTIIAVGTSLPEISASIVAVKKGHSGIAIGNVIGSNIFNTLGIIGACAIFSKSQSFTVPKSFLILDIPIMLISTLLFCLLLYYKNFISKKTGIMFIISYFIYILFNLKLI